MANEYKSFYLKDIEDIIDHAAMFTMQMPIFRQDKKLDGTLMTLIEMSNHNSLVAVHNEGVRELAMMLKRVLRGDEEENADE